MNGLSLCAGIGAMDLGLALAVDAYTTVGYVERRAGGAAGCRIGGTLWDSESLIVRVDARSPAWVDELRAVGNVGAPPVVYADAFLTLCEALASRA